MTGGGIELIDNLSDYFHILRCKKVHSALAFSSLFWIIFILMVANFISERGRQITAISNQVIRVIVKVYANSWRKNRLQHFIFLGVLLRCVSLILSFVAVSFELDNSPFSLWWFLFLSNFGNDLAMWTQLCQPTDRRYDYYWLCALNDWLTFVPNREWAASELGMY